MLTITQNDIVGGAPLRSPEAISMFRPCIAHMAERAIEPRRRRRASALHSRRCVSRGATGTSTRPPPPQRQRRGESQRRQNLERASKAARVGGVRAHVARPPDSQRVAVGVHPASRRQRGFFPQRYACPPIRALFWCSCPLSCCAHRVTRFNPLRLTALRRVVEVAA